MSLQKGVLDTKKSENEIYQRNKVTRKYEYNKMERLNGEVRDREKVIRGLKKDDTTILKGYQLFHNFIRPHEALRAKHQQTHAV